MIDCKCLSLHRPPGASTLCMSLMDVAFVCWDALWDQWEEGERFYDMTFCLFLCDTFPEASSCGDYWMYLVLCHIVPALNTSWQPRHEQRCQLIMGKRSAVTCSWSLWAAGHPHCHQGWCIPEALAACAWALCQLYMAKVNSSLLLQRVYCCNELIKVFRKVIHICSKTSSSRNTI